MARVAIRIEAGEECYPGYLLTSRWLVSFGNIQRASRLQMFFPFKLLPAVIKVVGCRKGKAAVEIARKLECVTAWLGRAESRAWHSVIYRSVDMVESTFRS